MKRELCAMTALLGFCATAAADEVYKCVGGDGRLSYQSRPCAQGQNQSTVTIHKAPPPPVAAPARDKSSREEILRAMNPNAPAKPSTGSPKAPAAAPPPAVMSYKCTAKNGWVFYRHRGCPVAIETGSSEGRDRFGSYVKQRYEVSVEGVAVPRAQACAQIHTLSVSSRDGYTLDERVSTYDKNLGRDICHGY